MHISAQYHKSDRLNYKTESMYGTLIVLHVVIIQVSSKINLSKLRYTTTLIFSREFISKHIYTFVRFEFIAAVTVKIRPS
jgi:hypothetical protein